MPHLPGHAHLNHDHQGVPAQVLCGVHHHSSEIWSVSAAVISVLDELYSSLGNKECPTCRKKLVSKRSLRPDPNFDQLVAKIFPDREEYEEQQEKVCELVKNYACNHKFMLAINNIYL